ncbi:MAG: hypothetical protein K8R48_01040 [Alphaproteobacteria bacterium]|nr:hypothetical protein [Alphaproteobacteria bacterium]
MKSFRLKEKFRAALLSGVAALSLMTSCNHPAIPEAKTPERQNTEWVPDANARRMAPREEDCHPPTIGNPDVEDNQAQLAPAENKRQSPLSRIPDGGRADFAPVVETDTVKAETVPPSLPQEQTPVNVIPNINLAQTPTPAPVETAPIQITLPKTPDTKWKFKIYASHAFTHYYPSDITIKTSRYDVKIKDYEWHSRDGNNWFSPKNIFFVSAFHPKFYQNPGQEKLIQGTVDGVAVDHVAPVSTPFHGYYQVPGEMKLGRNENTYRQMEYEVGYAHRFNLLSSRKFGTLSYVPGLSAGFQMGATLSVVVQKDKYWDFDDYHEKTKIQGLGGSIRNKLEWTTPNQRFGIFVENKTAFYHRKHDLLDGTQEFNLRYNSNNVGMTFMLYNPNRHKAGGGPKL